LGGAHEYKYVERLTETLVGVSSPVDRVEMAFQALRTALVDVERSQCGAYDPTCLGAKGRIRWAGRVLGEYEPEFVGACLANFWPDDLTERYSDYARLRWEAFDLQSRIARAFLQPQQSQAWETFAGPEPAVPLPPQSN
jgi:hypothetical protein